MKRILTFISLILCMVLLCSCVMEGQFITEPSDSSSVSQIGSSVSEVTEITEDPQSSTITTTNESVSVTEAEIGTEPITTDLETEQETQTELP